MGVSDKRIAVVACNTLRRDVAYDGPVLPLKDQMLVKPPHYYS